MASEAQIFAAVDALRDARQDLRNAVAERDAAILLRTTAVAQVTSATAEAVRLQAVLDTARANLKALLNE